MDVNPITHRDNSYRHQPHSYQYPESHSSKSLVSTYSSVETFKLLAPQKPSRYQLSMEGSRAPAMAGESYNQVPKRFSQFIIDQQNPHTAQKLDNLSLTSPSFNSEFELANRTRTNPSSSPMSSARRRGSRDISDSMESQATIFSTRGNPQYLRPKKNKSRFFRRKREVSIVDQSSSANSQLSRRGAIRFKKGSVIYRMWLRVKKAFRAIRCRSFLAPSPTNRSPVMAGSNRKLKRKYRQSPKNPEVVQALQRGLSISGPTTNPNLGLGTTQVDVIDDSIKRAAGAIPPPKPRQSYASSSSMEREGRMRHLSNYIDQQRSSFSQLQVQDKQMDRKQLRELSETSPVSVPAPAPRSSHTHHKPFQPKSKQVSMSYQSDLPNPANMPKQRKGRKEGKNKVLPQAPLEESPVEHDVGPDTTDNIEVLDKTVVEEEEEEEEEDYPVDNLDVETAQVVDLWRTYLKAVVTNRIKLRQEVNDFRAYLEARAETPTFESSNVVSRRSSTKPEVISLHSETSTATLDSQSKRFTENRRSMLGEMLEYESDDESVESRSVVTMNNDGAYSLTRDYGTVVVRRRGSATNSNASAATYPPKSPSSPGKSPIRRSRAVKNLKISEEH